MTGIQILLTFYIVYGIAAGAWRMGQAIPDDSPAAFCWSLLEVGVAVVIGAACLTKL